MVTVKVIWSSNNRPVQGSRVSLGFSSGMSEELLTDENGEAEFEDALPGRHTYVYVDGGERWKGSIGIRKVIGI